MEFSKFKHLIQEIPDVLTKGTEACAEQIAELFPNLYDDTDMETIDTAITAWKNRYPAFTPATKDIRDIFDLIDGEKEVKGVETLSDTFCGIAIGNLTADQKTLFNKLNPAERQKLSDTVRHNPEEGQFEFSNTARGSLALQDKDSGTNVNKSSADTIAKQAGNGWKLPEDIGSRKDDTDRWKLHGQDSDLDAMIAQMPGANDDDKVENFRLLTGMSGRYWTGTSYNKSSSRSVVRYFFYEGRSRNNLNHNTNNPVRLVRSLEAK